MQCSAVVVVITVSVCLCVSCDMVKHARLYVAVNRRLISWGWGCNVPLLSDVLTSC